MVREIHIKNDNDILLLESNNGPQAPHISNVKSELEMSILDQNIRFPLSNQVPYSNYNGCPLDGFEFTHIVGVQ